jgi:hypothetical protein
MKFVFDTDGDGQNTEPDHQHNGDFFRPGRGPVETETQQDLITNDHDHRHQHSHGKEFENFFNNGEYRPEYLPYGS